jgi:hypothetical protein
MSKAGGGARDQLVAGTPESQYDVHAAVGDVKAQSRATAKRAKLIMQRGILTPPTPEPCFGSCEAKLGKEHEGHVLETAELQR